MWIFRYTYCLFQGHAFVDITTPQKPYKYCLHCGKVQEPSSILVNNRIHSKQANNY
jgi:hypothetical protein